MGRIKRGVCAVLAVLGMVATAGQAAGQDAIDLRGAVYHAGSPNVADWPITARLEGVEFRDVHPGDGGVRPLVSVPWGEVVPDGWDGPVTHSLWIFRQIGGRWHGACVLEFFRGKAWTGAPLNRFYAEWVNPGKGYGELEQLGNVRPGELVGFMVTAGSHRLKDTSRQNNAPRSVRERSNVIAVPFAASGLVTVAADAPAPAPAPVPPVVAPGADVAALQRQIEELKGWAAASFGDVSKGLEALTGTVGQHATLIDELNGRIRTELEARPILMHCRGGINLFGLVRLSFADCALVP